MSASAPSAAGEAQPAVATGSTRIVVVVGLIGVLIGMLVAVRVLSSEDWDPTALIALGAESETTLDYAIERLGDVSARSAQGHDGKFFFVQANDPLHLDPDTHAANLDRPTYRAQRMLYPLLAGGAGLFTPVAVAWGMIVVNIVALGIGSWAIAEFARGEGWSPWWGLAFCLNIGMISEMSIGGAGIVAFAAAAWGLVAVQRDRPMWAAVAFTAAVLSREAMLLVVAGAAFWYWRTHRRIPWAWLLAPVIAAAGWAGYLRLRLGGLEVDVASIQEIGLPFVGFAQAAQTWMDRPLNLVTGITVLAVLLLFSVRALGSRLLLAWGAIGFVPLAIVFTQQVWLSYFDITRAIAPALTAWAIVTFAGRVGSGPEDTVVESAT
jgi:hypothetical protein